MLEVREGRLVSDGAEVDPRRVIGFHERYDGLTGRAWLEVIGAGVTVPIAEGYGAVRKAIRAAYADRPFTSDWADGVFPCAPLGLPGDVAFGAAIAATVALTVGATQLAGPLAGSGVAIALGWPALRLRDAAAVRRDGVRVGPPWAAFVPWHEVRRVSAVVDGRRVRVRAVTDGGAGEATLPLVLLPAFKARVLRLGAVEVASEDDPVDWKYARWRAPALGIPWGVLVGALLVAPWLPNPWRVVATGLLASGATALLGAGVSARANGWGAGGVVALTGVYAVILAAIGLALGGW